MITLGRYIIESDSNCFTIKQPRIGKNKKTGDNQKGCIILGHFGKFSQAINYIANKIVLDGTDTKEILEKLSALEKEVKSWNGDLVYVCGKIKGGE